MRAGDGSDSVSAGDDAAGREQRLRAFQDGAPADRYCDLILTGGVTSSIAYPSVILALAQAYRLHSIGGASSGAGSAALAAAAEYRRRHGSPQGYLRLKEHVEDVPRTWQGRTGLMWLFQPAPDHRRIFAVLAATIATPGSSMAAFRAAWLRVYGLDLLLALCFLTPVLAGVWPFFGEPAPPAWGAGLLHAALLVLLGGLLALARDALRLARDDFGACTGRTVDPQDPRPALTDWLHALLQDLAGRAPDGPPLTFGDLHRAPGAPAETLGDPSRAARDGIRLEIVAANVTHGRPYRFPLDDDEPPLYFCPREWRRLFPEPVVEHLMRSTGRARSLAGPADRRSPDTATADEDRLWELPREELPVIVAARMSVSFPLLFQAVPVWQPAPPGDPRGHPRRCLFVDGGLCSNFPIHLFDSLVPAWPTFGVALREATLDGAPPADPAWRTRCPSCFRGPVQGRQPPVGVSLPPASLDRPAERWDLFDETRGRFARLAGFFGALLDTTVHWSDATLARLPGVRERVVTIELPEGIGGLNIHMTPDQIRCLAELGLEAGRLLLERFAVPDTPSGLARGWHEHRWLRWRTLGTALQTAVDGLAWSAQAPRYAMPLGRHVAQSVDDPALADSAPLTASQAAALRRTLEALQQLEQALGTGAEGPGDPPRPAPALRVRPPM